MRPLFILSLLALAGLMLAGCAQTPNPAGPLAPVLGENGSNGSSAPASGALSSASNASPSASGLSASSGPLDALSPKARLLTLVDREFNSSWRLTLRFSSGVYDMDLYFKGPRTRRSVYYDDLETKSISHQTYVLNGTYYACDYLGAWEGENTTWECYEPPQTADERERLPNATLTVSSFSDGSYWFNRTYLAAMPESAVQALEPRTILGRNAYCFQFELENQSGMSGPLSKAYERPLASLHVKTICYSDDGLELASTYRWPPAGPASRDLAFMAVDYAPATDADFTLPAEPTSGFARLTLKSARTLNPIEQEETAQTLQSRLNDAGSAFVSWVRTPDNATFEVYLPNHQMQRYVNITVLPVLTAPGRFEALIDGQTGLDSNDIRTSSVFTQSPYLLAGTGADWGVQFAITPAGQTRFTAAAKGKTDYPIYMFMDRPTNALVVISKEDLLAGAQPWENPFEKNSEDDWLAARPEPVDAPEPISQDEALAALRLALQKENATLPVYVEDDTALSSLRPSANASTVILSIDAPAALKSKLTAAGFKLVQKAPGDMQPDLILIDTLSYGGTIRRITPGSWAAVGLQSAPRLSSSVTRGTPIPVSSYVITGTAHGSNSNARREDAARQAQKLAAMLRSGPLPVLLTLTDVSTVPMPPED